MAAVPFDGMSFDPPRRSWGATTAFTARPGHGQE
jgi:hypothetical protein